MPIESKETLALFKPGYKEKNFAPDPIPVSRIANIGMVAGEAYRKGLIKKDQLYDILAITLLEGRSDYGANSNEYPAPKGSTTRKIVQALYGNIPSSTGPVNSEIYSTISNKDIGTYNRLKAAGDYDAVYTVPSDSFGGPQMQDARNMILKFALESEKNSNTAIERYNGAGPAARNYTKLVTALKEELTKQYNKPIVELFDLMVSPVGEE